jgi:hypothetical protein
LGRLDALLRGSLGRDGGGAWLTAGKLAGGESWLAAGELAGSRERGQRLPAGGYRGMREG